MATLPLERPRLRPPAGQTRTHLIATLRWPRPSPNYHYGGHLTLSKKFWFFIDIAGTTSYLRAVHLGPLYYDYDVRSGISILVGDSMMAVNRVGRKVD